MKSFNNTEYETLVTDLVGDIHYTENSYRNKTSLIRQYAEVIVRKLLDLDQNNKMTLGEYAIIKKIDSLNNNKPIKKALKIINKKGSNCTHTQYTKSVSKDDFGIMMDKLFDMLAFLLINYFEKYEFGSNGKVMSSFSLLPPIIRYKVLDFLYQKNPDNIAVIDKLVLAIIKAYNVEEATKWVEEKKDKLIKMKTMSEKAFNEISEKRDVEFATLIQNSGSPNMYILGLDKISQVGNVLNSNGIRYSDFESALPHYQANGVLIGNEPEIKEFNDIMSFLYLGRKAKLQELSSDNNPYIVINIIS